MKTTMVAVAAAMAVTCARAEAAVYTTSAATSFVVSDQNLFSAIAYVPSFNDALGTLNTTTIRLVGNVSGIVSFGKSPAPTAGVFYNSVTLYNAPSIGQDSSPIINNDPNARSIVNNFAIDATSGAFNSTLTSRPNSQLDVSVVIDSIPSQSFASGVSNRFSGTIYATYDYTPTTAVPEPLSMSLLLAPLAGILLSRRRSSR